MLTTRVIPTLLLKRGGLFKGVSFENHKYVGDPINAIKIFNEKEVDELIVLDINTTIDGTEPDYEYLKSLATQAFMPIGYGGGISTIDQIEKLFTCGIEKVIINTAASTNMKLLSDASRIVGSQGIVVSIDVKKHLGGRYSVFTHSGLQDTGLEPSEYAKKAEDAGAGEVILCSIDQEGTGKGYDLRLIKKVAEKLSLPVVASGGAASLTHFREAIDAGASAVTAGSMFVFQGKYRAVLISYPKYSDLITALK